ncbi:unnamed protein product [Diabrotica balteata]|uniref:Uncharacterized protein n=1 Tax=Diabrotica balteata TaxID=107213 RepID=A0A9N9TCV4_DIABA|nr:unnamed protein product [Diabrotica balteata]
MQNINDENCNIEVEAMQKKVFTLLTNISEQVRESSNVKALQDCCSYLKKASLILNVEANNVSLSLPNTVKSEPTNKKIEKQLQFFFTKKKQKLKKLLSKSLNMDEKQFEEGKSDKEILDNLLKATRYDKRLLPPVRGKFKKKKRLLVVLGRVLDFIGDMKRTLSVLLLCVSIRIGGESKKYGIVARTSV